MNIADHQVVPPGLPRIAPRPHALLLLAAVLAIAPGLPHAAPVANPDVLAGTVDDAMTSAVSGLAAGPPESGSTSDPTPGVRADHPSAGIAGAVDVMFGVVAIWADHQIPEYALVSRARDGQPPSPRWNATGDLSRVEPALATPAKPAALRWTGAFNLYRATAFVTQKEFKWCVAASVQMMVNIVGHTADRSGATQESMLAYAQSNDHGPWGPGGGTDVTGWIVALRHFGAGRYRAVGTNTPSQALRIAAIAMRQTGRPAGMLVMDGQHAWVLHGFESRTDPRRDHRARISSVRVSGPLYPIQQKHGYDMRPNTRLSVEALSRYFHPSTVGAMVGKYVVIVPVH